MTTVRRRMDPILAQDEDDEQQDGQRTAVPRGGDNPAVSRDTDPTTGGGEAGDDEGDVVIPGVVDRTDPPPPPPSTEPTTPTRTPGVPGGTVTPGAPDPPGPPDGGGAFSGAFNQNSFLSFISSQPPTAATLDTFWNQNRSVLEAQGWGYISHPTDPKFVTPDGRFHIDVIQGGGGPNPRWQWLQEPANVGGVPLFGGTLSGGGFGTTSGVASLPAPTLSAGSNFDLGPDPFGPLVEGILGDLAANQGMTEFGLDVSDALMSIIEGGGAAPNDTTDLQFERAREGLAKAERIAQGSLRDALANRNLLSVSGIDQGPEVSSIGRVQQRLGEEFAGTVRDIFIEQSRQDDNRLTNALSLATGLASDQARSLLSVAQAAGREREVLSNIALGVLDRNMAWNMFLAQHGLDRAQVMAQIQQGNIALLLPLISQFFQGAQQSAAGFI